jgi:hypothetical protein
MGERFGKACGAVSMIVVRVKTAAVVHGNPGMGIALAEFPQGVLLGTQYAPVLAVALRPCLISFRWHFFMFEATNHWVFFRVPCSRTGLPKLRATRQQLTGTI